MQADILIRYNHLPENDNHAFEFITLQGYCDKHISDT